MPFKVYSVSNTKLTVIMQCLQLVRWFNGSASYSTRRDCVTSAFTDQVLLFNVFVNPNME